MAGNLSQKERTIIQDQMRHEEVCINKYNEYARRTSSDALRGLFNEFAKEEEQHYQTLNGLLGGSKSPSKGQTGGVGASGDVSNLSGMSDEEFIRQAAEQRLQGRTQQHVMPGEEALTPSGWSQQITQQDGQQSSQRGGQQVSSQSVWPQQGNQQFNQQSGQQFSQQSSQQFGQQSSQRFNQQSGQQSGWPQQGLQGQLQQPSQSRMAQQAHQSLQSQQLQQPQQSSQLQSGQSQQDQQSQQFRSPQSFQEASRELIPMFRAETAQEFAGAGSNADESSIVRDMLMTEQFVSGSYDSAIFDSISQNVRQALQHIQKDEQKHGQKLREYMQSRGQS
ncbi:MAG: spore coat protein [Bacillota bacterium]